MDRKHNPFLFTFIHYFAMYEYENFIFIRYSSYLQIETYSL
jgi:hypothetical protein